MNESFYKLGGIYSIVHIESGRPYIGSALLFFKRWSEHIKNAANSHRGKKRTEEQARCCAHGWTDEQKKKQSEILKQYFANLKRSR